MADMILLRVTFVTLGRQQVGFEIFRVDKMVDMILLNFESDICDLCVESSVVLRF